MLHGFNLNDFICPYFYALKFTINNVPLIEHGNYITKDKNYIKSSFNIRLFLAKFNN